MHKKRALITGITGQDGSYLAELLLEKGYEVHGIIRRSSVSNTNRIDSIKELQEGINLTLHYGDLTDSAGVIGIVEKSKPHEIYNLAAQSHVGVSFDQPEYTADCVALGALRLLEAIRVLGIGREVKFYQASTSELFGLVQEVPQSEKTPFYPRSPYAIAKQFAYWAVLNYREGYEYFACNGILFNHESPRRGETFVTRKITMGLARIKEGIQKCLFLGNIDAMRDWGHARDYVEAQWLMLQQDKADDYVIATGKQHSVREFSEVAGACLGMDITWEGSGLDEVGLVDGVPIIRIDPRFYRPTEVETLLGDPSKALSKMGWSPKITFEQLAKEMAEEDLKMVKGSI